MNATAPKKKAAKPKQGRSGIAQTFYFEPEVLAAIEAYRSSPIHKIKPSKIGVQLLALQALLAPEGLWPWPPKDASPES